MPIHALEDRRPQIDTESWVADNATVIGSVVLERHASIWFNCVLRSDSDVITVGEGSNIQDGSVLHTDAGIRLTVGRFVTVGHMAMLSRLHGRRGFADRHQGGDSQWRRHWPQLPDRRQHADTGREGDSRAFPGDGNAGKGDTHAYG